MFLDWAADTACGQLLLVLETEMAEGALERIAADTAWRLDLACCDLPKKRSY